MELVPRENIYGHRQRLYWLRDHLRPEDRAVEFGCGTGRLITIPLRSWGYDVTGVDLDETSIAHGREVLERAGLDPDALLTTDLSDVPGELDAVIASEILEHLDDEELRDSLAVIREKLKPGGQLLVTTPNGYSLFELENLLWYRTGVDRLYRRLRSGRVAGRLRGLKASHSEWTADDEPMTLADSPHKQRFTWRSIHDHVAQVSGQQRVLVEARSLEHLAPVGDARLVEVDPDHVVAPGAQRDRDQPPGTASELDGTVLWPQVVA